MSKRTVKHEIKLQPSVIVILGILAVGVCAIAFFTYVLCEEGRCGIWWW